MLMKGFQLCLVEEWDIYRNSPNTPTRPFTHPEVHDVRSECWCLRNTADAMDSPDDRCHALPVILLYNQNETNVEGRFLCEP